MFAVLATPPTSGIYADLQPRYQMYNTGGVVLYSTKEQAQAWADACNSDHNKWKYVAEEVLTHQEEYQE